MSVNFSDMPYEIEVNVFTLMDDKSLAQCSVGCRRWREEANFVFYQRYQKILIHLGQSEHNGFDDATNYKKKYFLLITSASNREHYYKIKALIKNQHDQEKWPLKKDPYVEWDFDELHHPYQENVRYKKIYDTLMTKKFKLISMVKLAKDWVTQPTSVTNEDQQVTAKNYILVAGRAAHCFSNYIFLGAIMIDTYFLPHHLPETDRMCGCAYCLNIKETALEKIATKRVLPMDIDNYSD